MDKKDIFIQKKIEKILLAKRGFIFKMPKKNKTVILLYSGGLDSTSLWFLLIKKFKLKVVPILFYSSKFNYLIKRLTTLLIESFFQKKYKKYFYPIIFSKINLPFYFKEKDKKQILTDYATILPNIIRFDSKKLKRIFGNQTTLAKNFNRNIAVLPTIPGRLFLFSYLAFLINLKLRYKIKENINTIFAAYTPEDILYNSEGNLTQIRALNLNFGLFLGNFFWQINAPIDKVNNFYYGKNEMVKLAYKYKVPIFKTYSCVKSPLIHCGSCFNCLTRKRVFNEINVDDRTFYFTDILKIFRFFQNLKIKLALF